MDTQPLSTNCCPKCHAPLPPDAPQGLCPKCLFAAVATPTEAGQPAGHRAPPPPLEEIAAAFPQLEILEFIGQGGMGFVFKARQPKLDRLVALKILPQSLAADPTFAERFNREARLLARLSHPGIVTVHDFGVASVVGQASRLSGEPLKTPAASSTPAPEAQFYFLLMEFVDGVNLRQAMQAGRFTPEQALAIVPKICEALQFAHNEGILHRDIKPENILLDAKGRVKLADFGIAKLVGDVGQAYQPAGAGGLPAASSDAGNTGLVSPVNRQAGKPALRPDALTETGKALGTPNYMAPEQLANAGEVDHRADIYSLGVVFYEMLTGELPLGRFAPPSQKSAADPRVDEVVLRALEKEKARRYASADEVRTQVETLAIQSGHSASAEKNPPKQPLWTWWWFQSCAAGLVLAHMTKPERRNFAVLYGLYSAWCLAAGFGIPAIYTAWGGARKDLAASAGLVILLLSLAYIFNLVRHFLCSTQWARAQGITPDSLPLFSTSPSVRGSGREPAPHESGSRKVESLNAKAPRFSPTALFGAVLGITFGLSGVPFVFRWVNGPMFPGLFMLSLAACCMTLCGWVAVAQIRRSAGKLYGLVLAVFDGLLFPLLGLNVLVGFLVWVVLGAVVSLIMRNGHGTPSTALAFLLSLPILIPLNRSIIRRVWLLVNNDNLDSQPDKPRIPRWVMAGLACIVCVGICVASFMYWRNETADPMSFANRPDKLRSLPTDRLIQVAIAERQKPWAWQELKRRAQTGQVMPHEALTIVDNLTAWMRREHPQGYNQPLHWIDGLLDEFQPWIASLGETNALAFLEAYYGNPSFWPVPRIRENETTLDLTCEWRSSWLGQQPLGFAMLSEMRSISIDGRQVPTTYHSGGNWNDSRYFGKLQLPKLAPGKHVVRCEVDSAFVADHDMPGLAKDRQTRLPGAPPGPVPDQDMPGLAKDASSKDWPPAKRRWTRVCEAEFMVYSPDAEIVRLSDDPVLNPVAGGALSCRQIIIRSESGHLTATAPFDVHSKVGLPISVDVALRLAGQTFQCGKLFAVKTTKVPMGTLGSGGDQELTVEIGALDPQIKEAEIVLTPNPRAVEEYPYVDRIWGKEIVISHVPLSRQDLYGARPAAASATNPATNAGTNWPGRDYYVLYAWDVSYNLTTNVSSLDSRWQVLRSAISKLRDEGLKKFPDDAHIHRELAWLFQHRLGLRKVGGETSLASVSGFRRSGPVAADPDQIYFRYQWLKLVEQAQADGQLQARLKLDPALMKSVDAQYGPLDWRLPESHAIYWVYRRLNSKPPLQGDDLTTLQRVIYRSLQHSYQHGKLIGEPSPTEMRLERNLDLVPKVDAAYIQQISSFVSEQAHIRIGHRNFLLDAIVALHEAGRKTEASNLYDRLSKLYPEKPVVPDDPNSLPARLTCEEFVRRKLNEK